MGFFDYIMRGIGFESAKEPQKTNKVLQQPVPQKQHEQQQAAASAIPQAFNLPVYEPAEETENNDSAQTAQYEGLSKNVIVYNPKTQNDVKNLIDFLRRKEPIIVNFSLLPPDVAGTMISFISGALYALRGSIHPIAGELYLLTPEGVNILVPKEK